MSANNPKGMQSDLTSISNLLTTILQQIKDIGVEAEKSTKAVSGLTKGATSGSGTKRGNASTAAPLANTAAPTGGTGMSGGVGLADVPTRTGQTQAKGSKLGTTTPYASTASTAETAAEGSKGSLGLGAISVVAGIGAAGAIVKMSASAMPDVAQVTQRMGQYYSAGVTQGNVSRSSMQSAAISSGLTKTGISGDITKYLSDVGVSFSSASNSEWMQKSRSISNAVQYLNMDPTAAAQAVAGLNSGATSKSLMMTQGISTSDPFTGKAYSQQQIFDQIHARLKAGRRENTGQQGVEEINASYYRGNLKESLLGMGLSEDQADLYRQWEVAKAQGQNMDLSSSSAMSKMQSSETASGNENPNTSGYTINASTEKMWNTYQEPYLNGIKDATKLIVSMNDALEEVPTWAKQLNANLATLAGSKGTGAVISGLGELAGVVETAIASFAGMAALRAVASGASSASSGAAGAIGKGATGMLGGVAGKALGALGIAGGAVGAAMTVGDIFSDADAAGQQGIQARKSGMSKSDADIQATSQAWQDAMGAAGSGALSGMAIGAGLGTIIPGLGTVVGGAAGAAIGGLAGGISSWFSSYNANMGGYTGSGGTGSSVGTGSTSQSGGGKPSFARPVGGPVGDKFGATEGRSNPHRGIDFPVREGTSVAASADGTVAFAGWNDVLGNEVEIQHAGGYLTIYAHLSRINVRVGDTVKQGQIIGLSGNTGSATTGPHLHFGMKLNGQYIDPLSMLGGTVASSTSTSSTGSQSASSSSSGSSPSDVLRPGGSSVSIDSIMATLTAGTRTSFKTVAAYTGASSGASSSKASMSSSGGSNGRSNKTQDAHTPSKRNASMYLPGAPSAKTGDSYVAQDGPVNVHTGEAILTAEQAEVWRDAIKSSYGGGKGRGTNVTINLTIAEASQAEAQKFAELVKNVLENDARMERMGSR